MAEPLFQTVYLIQEDHLVCTRYGYKDIKISKYEISPDNSSTSVINQTGEKGYNLLCVLTIHEVFVNEVLI